MHEPAPIHPTDRVGVSSEEAARILGVSLTTIRRWIREGKLEAKRVSRPQGCVLQVMVSGAAVEETRRSTGADNHAPRRLHVSTAPADPPVAGAQVRASQEPSNEPQISNQVVLSLDRSVTSLIERQQQTIMELSGRVGYLQAELANARDTIRALQAPQEEPTVGLTGPVERVNDEVKPTGADASASATSGATTSFTRRWWHRLLWG